MATGVVLRTPGVVLRTPGSGFKQPLFLAHVCVRGGAMLEAAAGHCESGGGHSAMRGVGKRQHAGAAARLHFCGRFSAVAFEVDGLVDEEGDTITRKCIEITGCSAPLPTDDLQD